MLQTVTGEHRLYPDIVLTLINTIQRLEEDPNIFAVVLTAKGKFFCNGFDLKYMQKFVSVVDDLQKAGKNHISIFGCTFIQHTHLNKMVYTCS